MKPSSFDAEFFTDSDELDEPDMIFFNFWVGPEGDLGMIFPCFFHDLPMIPSRGESIEFDTLIIFPLVPGARYPQKP